MEKRRSYIAIPAHVRRNAMIVLPEGNSCLFCKRKFPRPLLHHVNEDRTVNDLDNLMMLCHRCHALVHSRINNVIKKRGIRTRRYK